MSNRIHKLRRSLMIGLCLGLLVIVFGAMSASAATIVIMPGNLQGWSQQDTSMGGSSKITTTAPRSGNGSVEMRGDKTRWQKGSKPFIGAPTSLGLLSDVTDFAFDWMVATDSVSSLGANYTPALRLLVYDPDGSVKYSELGWEGAYNGPVVVTKGTWVTTDMI
ncbi:MAG TPA: hypothetical protein PKJ56_03830, partial [Promineifilum sp.]|nr:hypothetical protein [Promineifilum sp.]